jgi:hypothetical protein
LSIGIVSSGLILILIPIQSRGLVNDERIIAQASSRRLSSTGHVGWQTCSCMSMMLTASLKMMGLGGQRGIVNRIRHVVMSKWRKLYSIQESLEIVEGVREGIRLLEGTLVI